MTTAAETKSAVTTWNIDSSHASAEFKVKHMMIANVRGHFSGVKGSLTLDEANVTNSKIEATIDASTIDTREPQRDAHLKSADFLEVEKFPTLSFRSTKVTPNGDGELKVEGDLTIHGVTKSVIFNVEGPSPEHKDPWGNLRRAITATTKINRKDYGLTWNAALETGGILVGEEVAITLEVEFIKAA